MGSIVKVVGALTTVALIGLVVLHPDLPLAIVNTVTKTITGTIGLAQGKG